MKVAITGATGYIGQHLANRLNHLEFGVIALSRNRPTQFECDWHHYDLSTIGDDLPVADVFVHLAANTLGEKTSDQQEVDAARRLLVHVKAISAAIIFVSSQAANDEAPTAYGRIKWQIEQLVLAAKGVVIRPGQVYGGELRGFDGAIIKLVKQLPVLPLFLPRPIVQPVHVEDLVEAIRILIESGGQPGHIYAVASPVPVSFSSFLAAIADYRLRLRRVFVPVPSVLVTLLVPITGPRSAFSRLRSLFALQRMNSAEDLRLLGLKLRPLESGMQPCGRGRRGLLLEAVALYGYVLNRNPDVMMLRPYVRAIELLRNGHVLGLSTMMRRCPCFLALYDKGNHDRSHWHGEFMWRISAATSLAEASPLGARVFLGVGRPTHFVNSVVLLGISATTELGWRFAQFVLAPWLSIKGRRWQGNDNED